MNPRLFLTAASLFALLALPACESPTREGGAQVYSQSFSSLSQQEQALITKGQIAPGFTPELVRLALGNPADIRKDTLSETWTYPALSNLREPIFRDVSGHPIAPAPTTSASEGAPGPAGFRVRFFDGRVISAN